jgi:hypothetical protein
MKKRRIKSGKVAFDYYLFGEPVDLTQNNV